MCHITGQAQRSFKSNKSGKDIIWSWGRSGLEKIHHTLSLLEEVVTGWSFR